MVDGWLLASPGYIFNLRTIDKKRSHRVMDSWAMAI